MKVIGVIVLDDDGQYKMLPGEASVTVRPGPSGIITPDSPEDIKIRKEADAAKNATLDNVLKKGRGNE